MEGCLLGERISLSFWHTNGDLSCCPAFSEVKCGYNWISMLDGLVGTAYMSETLLPQRFLFRFSAPCHYRDPLWKSGGARLEEVHRLVSLAELEDQAAIAEVSAA